MRVFKFVEAWEVGVDSFNRMDQLVDNFMVQGRRHDAWRALGNGWENCDAIARNRHLLRAYFQCAARDEMDLMMTEGERQALSKLPSAMTIYRGCYRHNRLGLSWSLDRDVAANFTLLPRYTHVGLERLLVTATVKREKIVAVKLGRKESEIIIAHHPRRPKIDSLGIATDC